MKITFVLPGVGLCGGVRSTFELANRLTDKGHEVNIIYPAVENDDSGPLRKVRQAIETAANAIIGRRIRWFDLKAGLIKVPGLKEEYFPDADIIMATWWKDVHHISRFGPEKGEKVHFIRAYEIWGGPEDEVNRTYTLPVHRICVAGYLKDLIEKKFNVHVAGPLKNGVNFDLFYSERKDLRCHEPRRIGILYRNQRLKGMADGFRAFRSVREIYPDVRLVLFGDRLSDEDMEMIKDIDDKEIHVRPYGPRLRKIYNSLDIFLFPSHSEGFPNPPMEAMACGAACVTTDAGAVREYAVHGETALVSGVGDTDALTRDLMSLVEDEGKRRIIADTGSRYIRQFTWDDTAEKLVSIFKDLVR